METLAERDLQRPAIQAPTQSRATTPRRDQLTVLLSSQAASQTSRKGGSMALLGNAPSPTPQFAVISHCHIIWEDFGTITFVTVFPKLLQTVTVPPLTLLFAWLHKLNSLSLSSLAMWSETLTTFLSLQLAFPVSKQPSWTGRGPKHNRVVQITLSREGNTSFFWPHRSHRDQSF